MKMTDMMTMELNMTLGNLGRVSHRLCMGIMRPMPSNVKIAVPIKKCPIVFVEQDDICQTLRTKGEDIIVEQISESNDDESISDQAVKPSLPMSRNREKGRNMIICIIMNQAIFTCVPHLVTARTKACRFSAVKTVYAATNPIWLSTMEPRISFRIHSP